jgi:predicted DCC family thiol-disulfide oxidoreductase YuxK
LDHPAYSYRDVTNIGAFRDDGPVCVMDASCGLCARGARWIARSDKARVFSIIPMQSDLGANLMRHYGLDPKDPLSWLLIDDGVGYTSLDAIMRVGNRLGGVSRGLLLFKILPRPLQDALYGWIARNRYRFLGRVDLCAMPDPDVQARLIQ